MNLLNLLNFDNTALIYAGLGVLAGWWLRRYQAGESKLPPKLADPLADLLERLKARKERSEVVGELKALAEELERSEGEKK